MSGNACEIDARTEGFSANIVNARNDLAAEVCKLIDIMKENLPGDIERKTISSSTNSCIRRLNELYAEMESRENSCEALCKHDAGSVLVGYFKIALQSPLEQQNEKSQLGQICFNYTDENVELSEELCKQGLIGLLVDLLNQSRHSYATNQVLSKTVTTALGILYNCSKSRNNLEYYTESNAVDVVCWYASDSKSSQNLKFVFIFSLMTLAFIANDDNNDEIMTTHPVISTAVKMLENAIDSNNGRANGFSSLELVEALSRLSNNLENSEQIIKEGVLTSLLKMMTKGKRAEESAATVLIWDLSFSDRNKQIVTQNAEIMKRLEDFKNPNLQRNAEVVSTLLKMRKKSSTLASDAVSKSEDPEFKDDGHVMISYSWKNKEIAKKLHIRLEAEGYKTWFDDNDMGPDILESMSYGVENANVFLMLASSAYSASRNCRTEVEYAYCLWSKDISPIELFPLYVEDNYKANGWLGIVFGMRKYYKFVSDEDFNQTFENLVSDFQRKKVPKKSTS